MVVSRPDLKHERITRFAIWVVDKPDQVLWGRVRFVIRSFDSLIQRYGSLRMTLYGLYDFADARRFLLREHISSDRERNASNAAMEQKI